MRAYLIKRFLLDLVYPNRCPFCNKYIPFDEYYCSSCKDKLSDPPEFDDYPNIDFIGAVTSYDNKGRAFVDEMKNENNGYALSAAAFLIYQGLASKRLIERINLITFIPMRRRDVLKRGYNQTKRIASELSVLTGKPCKSLLKKIKETREQKTLGAKERRENVKGAYRYAKSDCLSGECVLLIDDICTTGSTLSEAAGELKNAGAGMVMAYVFAKPHKKA